jgi:hypothetical protein
MKDDEYQETEDDSLTDPAVGLFFFVIFAIVVFSIVASCLLFGCKL